VACRRPTDPRPAQTGWLLVALRFKARRDDRIFKPGRRALLRNADRPRLAEQNELFYSAVSITFDREEITRNKSVCSLRTAFTEHVDGLADPEANRPGTLGISRSSAIAATCRSPESASPGWLSPSNGRQQNNSRDYLAVNHNRLVVVGQGCTQRPTG